MVKLSTGPKKYTTMEEMAVIASKREKEDALDEMLGHMPKTPKKKVGRPKKIVMESSSSESEEEKPKKKKVGRPKKVVESSSSESEEEKPKKKAGRPKKCSCGSGLDTDLKPYQKFYDALKANTAIRPMTS